MADPHVTHATGRAVLLQALCCFSGAQLLPVRWGRGAPTFLAQAAPTPPPGNLSKISQPHSSPQEEISALDPLPRPTQLLEGAIERAQGCAHHNPLTKVALATDGQGANARC